MAIDGVLASERRRRRRRRRQDKPPVAARLVLDDKIKGDVGILSEDLFRELFPYGSSMLPLSEPGFSLQDKTANTGNRDRRHSAHCPGPLGTPGLSGRRPVVSCASDSVNFAYPRTNDCTLLPFLLVPPALRRCSTAPCAIKARRPPQRHRCARAGRCSSAPRQRIRQPGGRALPASRARRGDVLQRPSDRLPEASGHEYYDR
jgi:hypothetical protein